MPIVKTTSKRTTNSALSNLVGIAIVAVIAFGAVKGLHAFGRWSVESEIKQHEDAIQTGKIPDESTVVLATLNDVRGSRWVYYKLGKGAYATQLRAAGLGCRFYDGGAAYTFTKYKPTDPIPFDFARSGATVIGECDVSKFGDGFDLAKAQQ